MNFKDPEYQHNKYFLACKVLLKIKTEVSEGLLCVSLVELGLHHCLDDLIIQIFVESKADK